MTRNIFFQRIIVHALMGLLCLIPASVAENKMPENAKSPSKGDDSALVSIVVFSDFQCPYCARAVPLLSQITEKYGKTVKIVFRQYPLSGHQLAPLLAEASLCAHQQGKFWEFHDTFFAKQKQLSLQFVRDVARQNDLDMKAFSMCLGAGETAEIVAKDLSDGIDAGVNGTPAFLINGTLISGAKPFDVFQTVIDQELQKKTQKTENKGNPK